MAFEYIVKGKTIKLPISHDRVAVRFREPSDAPTRRAAIEPKPEVGSFDNRYEVPNEKLTIVDVATSDQPGPMGVAAAVNALSADPVVERAAPVFVVGSHNVVAPNRLVVGFKPAFADRANEVINDIGGEIIRQLGDGNEYLVRLSPTSEPFDVVATLTKRVEVDYAEPDFVTIGRHQPRAVSPDAGGDAGTSVAEAEDSNSGVGPATPGNDPLLKFQYAAKITNSIDAWQTVSGSPAIRIAIIDEGVDGNHPDLRSALVGTFDAMDGDNNQQPNPWDAHGTACAGLAAAIPNNAVGVRGMGGGCSILAVRIASSPAKGADSSQTWRAWWTLSPD